MLQNVFVGKEIAFSSTTRTFLIEGVNLAERRMFAKTIVISDDFLDMPMSARLLYFSLGMFADDDGFVNSPKSIMRQVGASNDDMSLLIAKKYLIVFENGVIVIKHWRIHNYIRNDRYKETNYLEQKLSLFLDENKAYTQNENSAKFNVYGELLDNGRQVVYQRDTQDSIGKGSIEISKDSIGNNEVNNNYANKESNNYFCNSIYYNPDEIF